MKQLENLSSSEQVQLLDAIPMITILIAGADGKIDAEESKWADKLTDIRSFANNEAFKEFYEVAHDRQHARMTELLDSLPADVSLRNEAISAELTKLNSILPKLGEELAPKMYKGLISFARRIAEASGGVMGFFAVGKEEEKWVHLPMITPIHPIEDDEISDEVEDEEA